MSENLQQKKKAHLPTASSHSWILTWRWREGLEKGWESELNVLQVSVWKLVSPSLPVILGSKTCWGCCHWRKRQHQQADSPIFWGHLASSSYRVPSIVSPLMAVGRTTQKYPSLSSCPFCLGPSCVGWQRWAVQVVVGKAVVTGTAYTQAGTQTTLVKHRTFMYLTAVALTTPCTDSEFLYFLQNILLIILKWVKSSRYCFLLIAYWYMY